MPNEIDIILSAIDRASGNVTKLRASFTEFNQAIEFSKKIVAGLDKAYDAVIKTTVDYALSLDDMARKLGSSTEEAAKLMFIADETRVSNESLSVSFKAAIKGGILPNIESLKILAAQYQALPGPIEKGQFAMEKFGKTGLDMEKILELTPDQIDKLTQKATEMGLVLGRDDVEQVKAFNLAVKEFTDQVHALEIELGMGVVPAANVAVSSWGSYAEAANKAANTQGSLTDKIMVFISEKQKFASSEEFARLKVLAFGTAEEKQAQYTADAAKQTKEFSGSLDGLNRSISYTSDYLENLGKLMGRLAPGVFQDAIDAAHKEALKLGAMSKEALIAEHSLEGLQTAQKNLADAQLAWSQNVADYIIGKLKDMGVPESKLDIIRGQIDDIANTSLLTDSEKKKALDDLVKNLFNLATTPGIANAEKIKGDLQDFWEKFEPLDKAVKDAQTNFDTFTLQYNSVKDKTITLTLRVVGDTWVLGLLGGGAASSGKTGGVGDYSGPKDIDRPAYRITQMVKEQLNHDLKKALRSGSFMAGRK